MLLSPALFAFEFHALVCWYRLYRLSIAVVSVCKTRSQLLFTCLARQESVLGLASLGQRRNRLARANQALVQDRVAGEHSISKC